MKDLLIASNNDHKFEELYAILSFLPINLIRPKDIGINIDVAETGKTYYENALIKARAFHEASHLPVLADDSGLEVSALKNQPGILSHRFTPVLSANDRDRCFYLLGRLADKPQPWNAAFHCTTVFYLSNQNVISAHGVCFGQIIQDFRGENGFGYDPIFLVEGKEKTMAELPAIEKNIISHRARAIDGLEPLKTWALS